MVRQLARILVAVDFSRASQRAFEYALALASRHGAALVLVHAIPPDEPVSWHATDRLALIARFRETAERARVAFEHRVQQGDPAAMVLLHAGSLRPDLIVAGTAQRRGFRRFRARSVAARIAAKATVPVLLVPERGQAGSIDRFRSVAVAVDFSPASHRAIAQALALATGPADRVTLLHVVPDVSAGVPPHLYRCRLGEHQAGLMRSARRRLQLLAAHQWRTPAAIDTRILVGRTAAEIARAADTAGADLLVVGVQTRAVVSRALFGTTAARVLRASRVPVLAVPHGATPIALDDQTARQFAA